MLIFVTDRVEPWFYYICGQFAKINLLETPYRIVTRAGFDPQVFSSCAIIEYSNKKQIANSLFIPSCPKFRTDRYRWLNNFLPVYEDSIVQSEKGLDFDIFYNAFVHLSRLEEWQSEQQGRFIHSYAFRHPRKNRKIWKIPVVNHLFNLLEKRISSCFPSISFGKPVKPRIEFSHDVDYIKKTLQLRLKHSFFPSLRSLKALKKLNFSEAYKELASLSGFWFKNSSYFLFDEWMELENKLSIKSTFYIYAKTDKRWQPDPVAWLIDPSYDIRKDSRLKKAMASLIEEGHQIGLHGSYRSALKLSLFKKEKETLEEVLGRPLIKTRQHWLNYVESKTPFIHSSCGISFDSSIGFNDTAGFRAGVASCYNPFNHAENQAFEFQEIPLVLMDSHIHEQQDGVGAPDFNWLEEAMKCAKRFNCSILWHERTLDPEYAWSDTYVRCVRLLQNSF